jgi:hypothetical protein
MPKIRFAGGVGSNSKGRIEAIDGEIKNIALVAHDNRKKTSWNERRGTAGH